jgi:hypothetical protein
MAMSDWIEHNGKKYYEESYLILANENAKRHRLDSKRLDWLKSHVENLSRISRPLNDTLTLEYVSDISGCVAEEETTGGIRAVIDAAIELNSADSVVPKHSEIRRENE